MTPAPTRCGPDGPAGPAGPLPPIPAPRESPHAFTPSPRVSPGTTTFVVGTDGTETSEKLRDYLEARVEDGDTVIAVNSLGGGGETDDEDVVEGREALEVIEERVPVAETRQLVRGNSAQEDLLQVAEERGADELVVGIRKRSPTGTLLFGSTAQDLLLSTDRPVVTVPLTEAT